MPGSQRAPASDAISSIGRPLLTDRVPVGTYPGAAKLSFPLKSSQSRPSFRFVRTRWNSPRIFSPKKSRVSFPARNAAAGSPSRHRYVPRSHSITLPAP